MLFQFAGFSVSFLAPASSMDDHQQQLYALQNLYLLHEHLLSEMRQKINRLNRAPQLIFLVPVCPLHLNLLEFPRLAHPTHWIPPVEHDFSREEDEEGERERKGTGKEEEEEAEAEAEEVEVAVEKANEKDEKEEEVLEEDNEKDEEEKVGEDREEEEREEGDVEDKEEDRVEEGVEDEEGDMVQGEVVGVGSKECNCCRTKKRKGWLRLFSSSWLQ